MKNKVFCLGFHKTGTTSLAAALSKLGYKVVHGDGKGNIHNGDSGKTLINDYILKGNYNLPTLDIYDAFTDNPYFSIWYQLVSKYPNAKYILTIRETRDWIASCLRYYRNKDVTIMRKWMFGDCADPNTSKMCKLKWIEAYESHNRSVIDYFNTNNKELLILNLDSSDKYKRLCDFLDEPLVDEPYPVKNLNPNLWQKLIKRVYPKASY